MRWLNLALLLLYPVAWSAPLLRAGVLPFFGLEEISILAGLVSLWQTDILLAVLVGIFALIAPCAKTLGLALVQFGAAPTSVLRIVSGLGRLAMADIFLLALYVIVAKGMGLARVETGWGLYLFSGCVLASLLLGHLETRRQAAPNA